MTTNQTYTGWRTVQSPQTREMIRTASQQMSDLVRSTLGPIGLDKMVLRRMPDGELRSFVSNDGIAILEEFEGETDHPIANHFIRLAEDHEDDYGDGTTTTVLLASELLSTGMDLADRGIHPNDVVKGFSIGAQRALECWNDMAISLIDADGELDRELLRTIAMMGMTNGRASSWPLADVADAVVEAVLRVSDPETGSVRLSQADTVAVPGRSVADTTLVDGAVLPESVVTADHLLPLEGSVLLVDGDLQSRTLSASLRVSIESRDAAERTITALNESEGIAATIADTGVVAVVTTGDVDMAIAEELAGYGVVLLRNVKDSHFRYICRATGAAPRGPISPGTDIDPEIFGETAVSYRDTGRADDWIEFRASAGMSVPAVTLIVRGGTRTAAEEAERRIKGGKNALRACVKNPRALPVGGAPELAAAASVRSLAAQFDDREQLAVEAFADVLDVLPKTLARNAGREPLGTLAELRVHHDAGHSRAGLSTDGTVVDDVTADDGLDAFQVRVSSLVRAVEFANNLLRIDSMLVDGREPSIDRVLDEPNQSPDGLS